MRYLPFSLKYRPKNFDEIVNQDYIKKILSSQVKNVLAYPAFIFAGPRGIGKTTTARVFARSLNCLEGPTVNPCGQCPPCREIIGGKSVDVVEIDGASNRGIDQVRQLREQAKYVPIEGKYKIYIIDEVHMLTNEAFNALLKTLEEPPPHVIFILATTAPAKVPQTVLSRCQRFDFRRIGVDDIAKKLKSVAKIEKIKIENEAINTIAQYADGSMRDALVILEQLTGYTGDKIKTEEVLDVLGIIPTFLMENLVNKIANKETKEAIAVITNLFDSGNEPYEIYQSIIKHLRLILFIRIGVANAPDKKTEELVQKFNPLDLLRMLQIALDFESILRKSSSARVVLEVLIIKLIQFENSVLIEDFLQYHEQKDNSKDLIESFIDDVTRIDKELASNLRKAKLYCEQDRLLVYTQDTNVRNRISEKKVTIESALKRVTGVNVKLEMTETTLKDKLMNLFDGEEIR